MVRTWPAGRSAACWIQLHHPVADLRQGNKHLTAGILVEPAVAGIADNSDDLARRFFERGPHACADDDSLSNGIFMRPEPAGHGFVDQDHTRRASRIALGETSAAHDGDPEDIEEARRNISPAGAALRLLAVGWTARN